MKRNGRARVCGVLWVSFALGAAAGGCSEGGSGAAAPAPSQTSTAGGGSVGTDCLGTTGRCDVCGCPPGLHCAPGGQCVGSAALGAPCESHSDCASGNCGGPHGCRVAVGENCTTDNCDLCLTKGTWSFCTRPCRAQWECGSGGVCNGTLCAPPCGGSCPGTCSNTVATIDQTPYCDCKNCYPLAATNRPLGQPCSTSGDCASGVCYVPASCSAPGCKNDGACSKPCIANADCGSGGVCASIPCAAGADPTTCGQKCLLSCDDQNPCFAGSCSPLRDSALSSIDACDLRASLGAPCTVGSECQSTSCAGNACVGSDGALNGGACARGTDCMSGNCNNSICRGQLKPDEACLSSIDCAAGVCCRGTCRSNCS